MMPHLGRQMDNETTVVGRETVFRPPPYTRCMNNVCPGIPSDLARQAWQRIRYFEYFDHMTCLSLAEGTRRRGRTRGRLHSAAQSWTIAFHCSFTLTEYSVRGEGNRARKSEIRHQTSDVRRQTSDIGHLRYPASRIPHPAHMIDPSLQPFILHPRWTVIRLDSFAQVARYRGQPIYKLDAC